jgi:hypothetical protein
MTVTWTVAGATMTTFVGLKEDQEGPVNVSDV